MSELDLNPRRAARVRIEITTNDGITYEVELANCDKANLDIERDSTEDINTGLFLERFPLESGEVKLTAHGRIVKTERRQA